MRGGRVRRRTFASSTFPFSSSSSRIGLIDDSQTRSAAARIATLAVAIARNRSTSRPVAGFVDDGIRPAVGKPQLLSQRPLAPAYPLPAATATGARRTTPVGSVLPARPTLLAALPPIPRVLLLRPLSRLLQHASSIPLQHRTDSSRQIGRASCRERVS